MLTCFPDPADAVVIGASGGIGAALVARLEQDPGIAMVHALSRNPVRSENDRIRPFPIDITDEASIAAAADQIGQPGLVIVATGILHGAAFGPEKTWRDLDADRLMHVLRVNAIGPALVAKHFLPRLPRRGKSVFAALSARVGSIGDNHLGGWYGYRASKSALNMLLKTLSVELARSHPQACILGLHPGTVATDLSEPFRKAVPPDRLFSPDHAARCLLEVIDRAGPDQTGLTLAWDGTPIPF